MNKFAHVPVGKERDASIKLSDDMRSELLDVALKYIEKFKIIGSGNLSAYPLLTSARVVGDIATIYKHDHLITSKLSKKELEHDYPDFLHELILYGVSDAFISNNEYDEITAEELDARSVGISLI